MALRSGRLDTGGSIATSAMDEGSVSGGSTWAGVVKADQSLSITDFEVLSKIGEGGFGTVLLVRKKTSGKLYALKVLVKRNMRRSGDARRAISERAAMQEIKHPFIVTLHFAFQDAEHVYFVLEFVGGGDLYSHLEQRTFSEEWARMYVAEIALAINHVHENDFVYRDLKPENILVGHDGHLKLADFGLAKKLHTGGPGGKRGRLNTMIGTMAFSAPEMFLDEGYGTSVDWWALGLLFCEMVTGDLPLIGLDDDNMAARVESFQKGTHLKPLPRALSKPAADLIRRLLTVPIEKRMCCGADGFDELKRHPFFTGLDWDMLYSRELEAPLKPLLGARALVGGTAGGDGRGKGVAAREAVMLDEEFGMYVGEDESEIQSRYAASAALCEAAAHSDLAQLKKLIDEGTPVDEGDYDKRTALHLAASEGLLEVVSFLIEDCGADVSPVDRWGGTPLDDAIRSKEKAVVEYLLTKHATKGKGMARRISSGSVSNANASAEVCEAASKGDLDTLRSMHEDGLDLSVGDYDKRTAIHLAASEGLLEVVKFLVEEAKCEVSPVDRWGNTPVDDAARSNHDDVEQFLRTHGAEPGGASQSETQRSKETATGALIEAAAKGDLDEMRRILKDPSVKVDEGDYDRRTALHLAASEGLFAVVEFLVEEAQASINPVDRWGGTPLDDAIRSKAKRVVAYLQANGGFPAMKLLDDSKTKNQSMNMCDAASQGNVTAIRVLISQGADVDQGDYDKRTALHLAASEGILEMVKLLVKEGKAELSPVDRWGGTPLDDAVRHKHDAVVDYLTKAGATRGTRMDATVGDLIDMAVKSDVEKMRKYLAQGVSVNAGDYDKRTALHVAASEGLLPVVKFLVDEAGAEVSPVDRWSNTPVDDAARHDHKAVVEYLIKKGATKGKKRVSILDAVIHADDEAMKAAAGAARRNGAASGPAAAAPRQLRRDVHAAMMCSAAAGGKVEQLKELVSRANLISDGEEEDGLVRADYDKRTPLHLAASEGQLEAVMYLVDEASAEVDAVDRWGNSAYDDAVREKHTRVAEFLQKRGGKSAHVTDVKAEGDAAIAAMCSAAYRGRVDTMNDLAQTHGMALAGRGNFDARTPLHLAAAAGQMAAAQFLLEEARADASPQDKWGHTPLDEAAKHPKLAAYLQQQGAQPGKPAAEMTVKSSACVIS